jgi:capsular polysaccharide biosynthesis protein
MDEMKALKKEMRLVISTIMVTLKTIILFGILGFLLSLLTMFVPIDNMYNASSAVCSTLFNDNYDNTKSVRLMESFMDIFESSLIQSKMVNMAGNSVSPEELQKMVSMKTSNSKTVLTITARHKDPAIAIKVANVVAYIMIMETDKLFETSTGIKILDKANAAGFAYRGRDLHLIICFLLTFFSAVGCAAYFIAKTLSSDKALFIDDLMDGSLEIIGVIPYSDVKVKKT